MCNITCFTITHMQSNFILIILKLSYILRNVFRKPRFFEPYKSHTYKHDWKIFEAIPRSKYIVTKENRIYIRGEFTRKKSVKRPFCCTVYILQVYFTYKCLGISFYTKPQINVKIKPNYEICWFHNWPMIISHRL